MTPQQVQRRRVTDQIRAGQRPTFTAFFEPERGALSWFVQVPQIYGAAKSSSLAEIEAIVRDQGRGHAGR